MYTLHDITDTSFSFEFVLHEPAGPGCHFAQTAQPGDTVAVSEPPYHVVVPEVTHALFIADTTAIPAISSFLGSLSPDMATTVILEDGHPDHDLIPLKTRENTRLTWVDALTEAILDQASADLDPNNCFLWAGGERHIAKMVKEYARDRFVVPRENQHIQTYWIAS
jgi:ATP-binding cassette subfamily B protein IrtA